MKVLGRTVLVGALAIAIVGVGLPHGSGTALAASAPTIDLLTFTPNPSDEGQEVHLHGEFTDADPGESHTVTVAWGGLLAPTTLGLPAGATSFDLFKTYPDDRPTNTPSDTYNVVVTLTDKDGLTATATVPHTVRDVAPTVSVDVAPATILEGDSVVVTLSFTDPSAVDLFTETFDFDDGSAPWTQPIPSNVRTYTLAAHTYALPGTYELTASVRDDDTLTSTKKVTLLVGARNTPPSTPDLTPGDASEGDPASVTASFTDPDAGDTHTARIDWGDSSSDEISVTAGVEFTVQHVYASHGGYTVTVTITDKAGATAASSVVVTVSQRTAGDLLEALATLVYSWNLEDGTQQSLMSKVHNAQDSYPGDVDGTCNALNALGNHVSAQTGKKLSAEQVTEFWAHMADLSAALPCAPKLEESTSSAHTASETLTAQSERSRKQ